MRAYADDGPGPDVIDRGRPLTERRLAGLVRLGGTAGRATSIRPSTTRTG